MLRSLLIVLVGLAPGTPAAAQAPCGGIRPPASGGWAAYDLTARNGAPSRVRFAVVGTESRAGTVYLWFETRFRGARASVVTQVLVPGFPYDPLTIQEVTLQADTGGVPLPPIRVTGGPALARARAQAPAAPQAIAATCRAASLVGRESVTVPGGTFATLHYRNAQRDADLWVSAGVPFGIVKYRDGQDRTVMVLTGSGSDAKSSLSQPARPSGT